MKKIPLLIILVFLLQGCVKNKKICITPALDKLIRENINYSNFFSEDEKNIVSIITYTIDFNQFIIIQPTYGYSKERLEGFCELNDYLLVYYGINNSVVNRFSKLDCNIESNVLKSYINYDESPEDVDTKSIIFQINKNGKFTHYIPDEKHNEKLLELFILHGIKVLPPFPPLSQ